jgi:hypothetical protein
VRDTFGTFESASSPDRRATAESRSTSWIRAAFLSRPELPHEKTNLKLSHGVGGQDREETEEMKGIFHGSGGKKGRKRGGTFDLPVYKLEK